ncbi:MAG: thiamine phosphate synthase [Alistipes sp.]|nr:thiamine phosphate synthase [Alistipes sp.]
MRINHYRLQFITHHNDRFSYLDSARLALAGGCRWIQLRMKGADSQLFEATAREVGALCREYGATFIIDDEVELAKRVGADGVHLGKEDMPVAEARAILGSEAIIGATVNSTEDILGHVHGTMPDYFGCGPFRFTTTKRRLAPTLGLDGYRAIMRQMHEAHISIPVVAIGGIAQEDITPLLECGVDGIALSGSVLNSSNPISYMESIVDTIYSSR